MAETRPLVSGVGGTRVFPQARGHGGSPATPGLGWDDLAADLLAAADAHAATQAVGVSLGAGTLLRLLGRHPDRFARVVLLLPAALDAPQPGPVRRAAELAAVLASRDPVRVEEAVRAELPADVAGPGVDAYVAARSAYLLASDLAPLAEALAGEVPVPDRQALAAVTAPVLVIGQEHDPVHPVEVARETAAALPGARLEVFPEPGILFRPAARARLRRLVSDHLAAPTGPTAT